MGDMLHDFGVNKLEKLRRSRFDFNMRQTQDQRQGALVPLCWHMVTPSEVWSCKAHSFNRLLLTLAKPLFADVYFTYGFYFVPLRILFKDYEKMFGDGSPQEWINPTEYIIPSISYYARTSGDGSVKAVPAGYDAIVPGSVSVDGYGNIISKPGNLANYLGLPVTSVGGSDLYKQINPAPLLAYERIWTDMFRDENYQNEDPDLAKYKSFNPGTSGSRSNIIFGLHYANRFHDYFSSLLPNTQKGPASSAFSHLIALPELYTLESLPGDDPEDVNVKFGDYSRNVYTNVFLAMNGAGYAIGDSTSEISGTSAIGSTNLGVDISVEKLRMAFATQRARERNARAGSRYVEAMLGTFEAHLSNGIAQRAEFLGGNTIKLNITSVPSTSDTIPGKLGAFSATRDDSNVFIKQFNEPGILMAVGTYRIKHRYSQGVDRQFDKLRRYDSYDPAFAHISEQPHTAWELAPLNSLGADTVIGFNEPWVEDLKPVDRVCGMMGNPAATSDFKAWVPVDNFAANASPNPAVWLPENGDDIANRCVDYNSSYPTWVFGTDFIAECKVTSPRPIYSIPGFIDHLIG